MQDVPAEFTEELAESIDSWRHSVPSRMEREDPFLDDGFVARPSTRVVSSPMLCLFLCLQLNMLTFHLDVPRAREANAPPIHSPRLHPRRHPRLPQATTIHPN